MGRRRGPDRLTFPTTCISAIADTERSTPSTVVQRPRSDTPPENALQPSLMAGGLQTDDRWGPGGPNEGLDDRWRRGHGSCRPHPGHAGDLDRVHRTTGPRRGDGRRPGEPAPAFARARGPHSLMRSTHLLLTARASYSTVRSGNRRAR